MRDVEIGFKFHNGTAEVPVVGRSKDVVTAFGILAASIARASGIPLGMLIVAAMDVDKTTTKSRTGSSRSTAAHCVSRATTARIKATL